MSLDLTAKVSLDETLKRKDFFTHHPYASTTYNSNDVIHIPIQHQDSVTVPCESYLHIKGRFVKTADGKATNSKPTTNALAFLFSEIKYELGAVEIAQTRNVGVSSTIKGYVSHSKEELNALKNSGWTDLAVDASNGAFDACIPLKMLMGYFEDQTRAVINMKQELILVRASTDDNAYITDADNPQPSMFIITEITWNVPHLCVSDEQRLELLNIIKSGRSLPLSFRCWELIEHPLLPATNRHIWQVKSVQNLETPRFILLAFQTARIGVQSRDSSKFDHCQLRNATVYLNSEYFPHTKIYNNFDSCEFAQLYREYTEFPISYYGLNRTTPLLDPGEFKSFAPIFVLNTNYQNETVKSGSIDIRIEMDATVNFPPSTTAYCLILYDRIVEYIPLTSVVNRII